MKKLGNEIGFDDAEFKSCEINSEAGRKTLIVYLNSWDAHIIKIVFSNVIHFFFKCGSFVVGLYEMDEDEFYKQAIAWYEISAPHSFKKYAIIDIEDIEFIEVVAEDVFVTKELQYNNKIK